MQEAAQTSPLQLLFIELRVGLARSAIQAALLLNGGGAVGRSAAMLYQCVGNADSGNWNFVCSAITFLRSTAQPCAQNKTALTPLRGES